MKKDKNIKKCIKCGKPAHKIEDFYGGSELGFGSKGKPLQSDFCLEHLIEENPKKFSCEIVSYAKAVHRQQEKLRRKHPIF